MLLSQLFQQLYNTADTFIVGQWLGTEALAAVSSSGALIFVLISFFEGLAMGVRVCSSPGITVQEKRKRLDMPFTPIWRWV